MPGLGIKRRGAGQKETSALPPAKRIVYTQGERGYDDRIRSANLDGSEPRDVTEIGGRFISGLAVAYDFGMIFYINQDEYEMRCCSLSGREDRVFQSDVNVGGGSSSMELSYHRNHLYYCERTSSDQYHVRKIDVTGAELRTLASEDSHICCAVGTGAVFYASGGDIFRVGLGGRGKKKMLSVGSHIKSLALSEKHERIYWLADEIGSARLDGGSAETLYANYSANDSRTLRAEPESDRLLVTKAFGENGLDVLDIGGGGKEKNILSGTSAYGFDFVRLPEDRVLLSPTVSAWDYTPQRPVVGTSVELTPGEEHDADGELARTYWQFPGGEEKDGGVVEHAYQAEGEQRTYRRVVDREGLAAHWWRRFEIHPAPAFGSVIYATDSSNAKLLRFNIDGNDYETLATVGGTIRGVAVDVAAGFVYVCDREGSVQRLTTEGENQQTVLSGLTDPYGIALHGGKMYVSSFAEGTVQRANLDGSQLETIVGDLSRGGHPAIDHAAEKLYLTDTDGENWSEALRYDLDGVGKEVLAREEGASTNSANGVAVDRVAGKFYMAFLSSSGVLAYNLDGSGRQEIGVQEVVQMAALAPEAGMLFVPAGSAGVRKKTLGANGLETILGGEQATWRCCFVVPASEA